MRYDVAVVGGGLVGAACADALAGEGLSVCLLEAGPFVREASWAAAGILHPIHPWSYPEPLQPLLRAAAAEHVRCAADLFERTGIDVELERSGLVVMGEPVDRLSDWCGAEIEHRRVAAREEEPAVRQGGPGLLIPGARHVRSHRLARAFLQGARDRGAQLLSFQKVISIAPGVVETTTSRVEADRTLLCAGAWAASLAQKLEIEPIRGQILLYRGRASRMVVFPGGEYVVPRRDGFLLFGSTLERAGFDARPTEEACAGLAARAEELFGLNPADQLAAWAGLRPGTRASLPYIGPDPNRPDLIYACGHYRNGILLAPLTARLISALLTGREPALDVQAFLAPHAGLHL